MHLLSYMGLNLKSDSVIELLEHFDMAVFYDFDRLHENTADSYSSASKAAGFELRFNEHQILDTIWCYIKSRHGFEPIDANSIGTPLFQDFEQAKTYAGERGIKTSESKDGYAWIRFDHNKLRVHYEFSNGELALLTFMLPANHLR